MHTRKAIAILISIAMVLLTVGAIAAASDFNFSRGGKNFSFNSDTGKFSANGKGFDGAFMTTDVNAWVNVAASSFDCSRVGNGHFGLGTTPTQIQIKYGTPYGTVVKAGNRGVQGKLRWDCSHNPGAENFYDFLIAARDAGLLG